MFARFLYMSMPFTDDGCHADGSGSVVPESCNDPTSHRDDDCANQFLLWWKRCSQDKALVSIDKKIRAELEKFSDKRHAVSAGGR